MIKENRPARQTAWRAIGLSKAILEDVFLLATEHNAKVFFDHPRTLPAKYKSKEPFVKSVFLAVPDQENETLYFLMRWYSQVAWWAERNRDVSITVFVPAEKDLVVKLIRASLEPLPYAQVIIV